MKRRQIKRQSTVMEDFVYGLYVVFPAAIVVMFFSRNFGNLLLPVLIVVLAGPFAVLFGRHIWTTLSLRRHRDSLLIQARARGWQVKSPEVDALAIGDTFGRMSLDLLGTRGHRFLNYIVTEKWEYIDWSYAVYNKMRGGEYKGADIYYCAMAARLPRVLPNVFFDAKANRGRQFKAKFSPDQRHGLEGNFDSYFDTYFAQGYAVDSLSFITPDVMEVLIAARDYDIEVVQDKLLFYAPIYVDARALNDMAAKLLAVHSELAFNARTYRDNRLRGAMAQQTVTPLGMFLRPRGTKWWVSALWVGFFLLIQVLVMWSKSK